MKDQSFGNKVKANVAHNFDRSIQIYRQFEQKHGFFGDLALKMADAIGLEDASSVLDVGCGYGVSAKAIHDRYHCKVLGVDLSSKMISLGREVFKDSGIRLLQGDGEQLSSIVGDAAFDYVLYNASIFIFPDVTKTIAASVNCLKAGGKIAFSFYPQLLGEEDEDLFDLAFHRLEEPLPKFKVITSYQKACQALNDWTTDIEHHGWVRPFDVEFLTDFFSIPAQSASLFPGRSYKDRRERVIRLFNCLEDRKKKGRIVWRMAQGTKG